MNKQINNWRKNPPRYGLLALLFLILAFLILGLIASFSFGALDDFLTVKQIQIILIVLYILLIVMAGLSVFAFIYWEANSSLIRFNYSSFAVIRNVHNERRFLSLINRQLRNHKNKTGAIIVFSPIKFKKVVFTRYGYEVGATVFEIFITALGQFSAKHPHSIYGYDLSDNFLVYLPSNDITDIKEKVEEFEKYIIEILKQQEILIKFTTDYGVSFSRNSENEPLKSVQMLQRALIASDYGKLETELGGVTFYEEKMFEKNKRNVQLAREVEKGLEENEFVLYFQPKYDLKLKRFSGAEALLRWEHPELGLLSPAAFILFAEQSDLIIQMDRYVVEKACQAIAEWRNAGERLLPISINISRRTLFTEDLVEYILSMTKKYDVNPMLIEIEITESPALHDILLLLSIIRKLKRLKIKVAIDDFGTRYSSLSYIKKIPFDIIKIDKAFLDDLYIDQKARDLVKNIIALAHTLDAYVIIEGVQDEKQLNVLTGLGADCIQGYYYSQPLRNDKYIEFLNDNKFETKRGKSK